MRALVIATFIASVAAVAAAGPLTGDVQVWQDARFYLAPSERAPSFALASLGKPRDQATGMTVQLHAVAEHGDFVEIADLHVSDFATTCWYWGELSVDPRLADAHLYVHRADLAPVLVVPWQHASRDGTRIALSPGVPVGPAVSGGRVIALSEHGDAPVRLAMAIPDADVGLAFSPMPRPAQNENWRWEIVTRTIALEGHESTLDHALPHVATVTYRGRRALVPVDIGCARLVASVPRTQVRVYNPQDDRGPNPFGLIGMKRSDDPALAMMVPHGTPLATTDGLRLATARVDFAVAAPTGGQACDQFTFAIVGTAAPRREVKLVLCAPASAVVPRPRRRRRGAAPPPDLVASAAIEDGRVTTSGGINALEVERVVHRANDRLVACYQGALRARGDVSGTSTVSFVIGASGRAMQASASGLPGVDACVAQVIGSLAFPRPPGDAPVVRVAYELRFHHG